MNKPLKRRIGLMLLISTAFLALAFTWHISREEVASSASGAALPAVAPVELGSQKSIDRLQAHLKRHPDDAAAYARLGLALLQRVRETADPSLYGRAEAAFVEALEREPDQLNALIGQGMLALARHDFADALDWAEQARTINPHRAQIHGMMADAQIELGRYAEAATTLQRMVDLRPDLSSYSRISYLRELHGDRAGAIEAMERAGRAGGPGAENTLWAQVQLGHLYFNQGDLSQAEQIYRQALRLRPDYLHASAGMARVRAAQGHDDEAIERYERIVDRLPLPEFVIALGRLYEATGRTAEASRQYELVRLIEQLNREAGMNVDLEMALFMADEGSNPAEALRQARAAYRVRPGIYSADALAWALYKNGDYAVAERFSRQALRLKTRDAMLYYHAGMIAAAQGHQAEAERLLAEALALNPYFDLLQARTAAETLVQLRN